MPSFDYASLAAVFSNPLSLQLPWTRMRTPSPLRALRKAVCPTDYQNVVRVTARRRYPRATGPHSTVAKCYSPLTLRQLL
jgi:hypothetical protein